MKYKKSIISIFAIIIVIIATLIVITSLEKSQIWIYNYEESIHDSVEVPFDLSVFVNNNKVFGDSVYVSTLPQAIIDVDFRWGGNCIVAYSIKASLYDDWCGFIYIDKIVQIQLVRKYLAGLEGWERVSDEKELSIPTLEILR